MRLLETMRDCMRLIETDRDYRIAGKFGGS